MSNLLNPLSPHDERFPAWVQSVALTAAVTALSENNGATDHYRPSPSNVIATTLAVAERFATYIETGAKQ